ncbi:hypothetical protein M6B38_275125 [Iris pallida]|uniref:Uncharacterized protein n=1 Tax=Iris pallida TaxID=29817 RepID=A0AAX6I682_IRIPA|nr:hypothetical protein M6B38_275125 [Iris pallida]
MMSAIERTTPSGDSLSDAATRGISGDCVKVRPPPTTARRFSQATWRTLPQRRLTTFLERIPMSVCFLVPPILESIDRSTFG